MRTVARRVAVCGSIAASATIACGSSAQPSAPTPSVGTPMAVERHIVVLGDSLAVSPSRTENFPAELQKRIDRAAPGWTVVNRGISGDTTAGGLRRFDDAITQHTGILILELGANDGLRGIATATVQQNLAAIIERAQRRGIQVLLCGMETPPTRGWNYTLSFHQVFPTLASTYNLPLVPFLLAGVVFDPELNGPDEIHPNAAGARRIADTVWPYLEPLLGSGAARRPDPPRPFHARLAEAAQP